MAFLLGAAVGLVFGGGKDETTVETNVLNEVLNETTLNILQKNTNIVKTIATGVQEIKIKIGGDMECDVGTFSQTMSGDIKMLATMDAGATSSLVSELSAQLDTTAEQDAEIKREFMSGIGAQNQDTVLTDIKNIVKTSITKNVTQENMNEAITAVDYKQGTGIEVGGNFKMGNCTWNQDMIMTLQIAPVMGAIAEDITSVKMDVETDTETKQKVVKIATGPNLFGGLIFFLIIVLAVLFSPIIITGAVLGRKGILIGLLIGIIGIVLYIVIYKSMNKRHAWERACYEICKDDCMGTDGKPKKDCVPCVTCPKYCPGDCEDCEDDDDSCYTCADCNTGCKFYCKEKCIDAYCIECSECDKLYPGVSSSNRPSKSMRVQYQKYRY